MMNIGNVIMTKRKELGLTQQALADKLHVSFQAISKWENGTSYPEIDLLPMIANVLHTSSDALLGYEFKTHGYYDDRYKEDAYYWGLQPNETCFDIMKMKPPIKPLILSILVDTFIAKISLPMQSVSEIGSISVA